MKSLNYLLVILLLLSACQEESESDTVFEEDYGNGMYVVTENGVSFYDGDTVKSQIYNEVNGRSVVNAQKIKFNGAKAYIVTSNQILIANVNTFEHKEEINGFANAVDFDFVNFDRLFVVDKGDSKVKVVDLVALDITSDIETGDYTSPSFILTKWYRSIVLNGGGNDNSLKDSTLVAIDYRDELVPLADFNGSIYVGDNPNSAVNINDLKVLCKGVYDVNNSLNNTEATLVKVNPWTMEVIWVEILSDIYNASNLVAAANDNVYFFTAMDGIYNMYNDGTSISQLCPIVSDVLSVRNEQYNLTDTTFAQSNMLYINDAINNSNIIYKYNISTQAFCDTIVMDGMIKDIAFY